MPTPDPARDAVRPTDGALIEGWYDPVLNASSPAPVPWTQEALLNCFYDGWDADHGIAAGAMQAVQRHTAARAHYARQRFSTKPAGSQADLSAALAER